MTTPRSAGDAATVTQADLTRYWQKVDKRGPDECWPWIGGSFRRQGRGVFHLAGRNVSAPQIALALDGRSKPADKPMACHTCDNPNCVNPAHLWWGSNSDNLSDAAAKNRLPKQQVTECPRGHPYSTENTYRNKKNQKHCRECHRIHHRIYAAQRKEREAASLIGSAQA